MKLLDEKKVMEEYGFLRDMVHVNCCSVGLPPFRTQLASREFMDGYIPMACSGGSISYEGLRARVRALIARLINCQADEIAFTKNTSEGISILAAGYPLHEGDEVVLCDQENQANIFPWINDSRVRGYDVKLVKTDGKRVCADDIIAAVSDKTRIVSVSMVQSESGCRVDLNKLCRACHERGVILSVDGIQGVGRLKLDLKETPVDFLSCGGFKGLLSGFGTGFLYCSEALTPVITPPYAGDASSPYESQTPHIISELSEFSLYADARRFESGSQNMYGIAMMEKSIDLILELGAEKIERHILGLERSLRESIAPGRLEIVKPSDLPSGMIAAYYPEELYIKADNIIKAANIVLTHREGYIRLALGLHNTERDIALIAYALNAISDLK